MYRFLHSNRTQKDVVDVGSFSCAKFVWDLHIDHGKRWTVPLELCGCNSTLKRSCVGTWHSQTVALFFCFYVLKSISEGLKTRLLSPASLRVYPEMTSHYGSKGHGKRRRNHANVRLLPLSDPVLFAGVERAQVWLKHRVCSSAGLLDSTQSGPKGAQKSKADHLQRLTFKAARRWIQPFLGWSDKSRHRTQAFKD